MSVNWKAHKQAFQRKFCLKGCNHFVKEDMECKIDWNDPNINIEMICIP